MRLTGFIMGGIIGASIAVFLSREQNRMKLLTSINEACDTMRQMMKTTKDAVIDMALNQKFGEGTMRGEGKESVKQMIDRDPTLKQEFDAIMSENSETRHTQ